MRYHCFSYSFISGLILLVMPGCARHYYYYNGEPPGVCSTQPSGVYTTTPPAMVTSAPPRKTVAARTAPVVVDDGSICKVPSTISTTAGRNTSVVTSTGRADTVIVDAPPTSRVIVNDPAYQGYTTGGNWRNSKEYVNRDYSAGATNQLSGVMVEDTVSR